MTVFENMAYSLRLKKVPKKERRQKVEEAAKILGLEGVLDRKPGELSGGQKQRVAMGRAIVRNPRIFLMDEPLSNLDAKLRTQMRAEILRLYQKLKTTFIYVTHDQTEADDTWNQDCSDERRSDSASRITGRTLQLSGKYICGRFYRNAAYEFLSGEMLQRRRIWNLSSDWRFCGQSDRRRCRKSFPKGIYG